MSERQDGPIWDPLRLWQSVAPAAGKVASQVAWPLTTTAAGLSMAGVRTTLQLAIDAGRSRLLGRRFTVGPEGDRVSLMLTRLDAETDPLLAAVGQVGDVTVEGTDVRWRHHAFPTVRVRLRNVHTRPASRPVIVAAPVDVVVTLTADRVAALVTEHVPEIEVEILGEGRMAARWSRRPSWGWVEIEPAAHGNRVSLRPTALKAVGRDWRFERRVPAAGFDLALDEGVRLLRFEIRADGVDVHLRLDEWRTDYLDSLAVLLKPGGETPEG